MEWYWIIGAGLTGWTFLTLMAREQQSRVLEMEAKRAAEAAAAKPADPESSKSREKVLVVR